jgi:hypothetical protein
MWDESKVDQLVAWTVQLMVVSKVVLTAYQKVDRKVEKKVD